VLHRKERIGGSGSGVLVFEDDSLDVLEGKVGSFPCKLEVKVS